VPAALAGWSLQLSEDGTRLSYSYDPHAADARIQALLRAISAAGLVMKDLKTTQSSLEEIFVRLVKEPS